MHPNIGSGFAQSAITPCTTSTPVARQLEGTESSFSILIALDALMFNAFSLARTFVRSLGIWLNLLWWMCLLDLSYKELPQS